jgi:hypothetical protein
MAEELLLWTRLFDSGTRGVPIKASFSRIEINCANPHAAHSCPNTATL